MLSQEKRQDIKEKAIVFGTFTFIFLPIRFFFYTYISQIWLGSFVLVTILSLGLLYLGRKNKLGKFGEIWNRQIVKIAKGKIGALLFFQPVLLLLLIGFYIFFIEVGNTQFAQDRETLTDYLEEENIDIGTVMSDPRAQDPVNNIERGAEKLTESISIIITQPERINSNFIDAFYKELAVTASAANELSGGWMLHMYSIWFIEQLEQIGLVGYFRYIYHKNP